MPTARQETALRHLPAAQAAYDSACALLVARLTPGQRLSRQALVRIRLAALNAVREAAGLPLVVGLRLLSMDELLAPKGLVVPAEFEALCERQREAISYVQAA